MRNRTIITLAGLTTLSIPILITWGLPEQTDVVIRTVAVVVGTYATVLVWVLPVMDRMLESSEEVVQQCRQEQEEWSQTMEREYEKRTIRRAEAVLDVLRTKHYLAGRKRIKHIRNNN